MCFILKILIDYYEKCFYILLLLGSTKNAKQWNGGLTELEHGGMRRNWNEVQPNKNILNFYE